MTSTEPATATSQRQTFRLPDLGEGLTEAEIVAWRVSEGDEVGIDDVVVDVETAKATVEVPCPYAGRVVERHAAVGDQVAVGAPLVTVTAEAAPSTNGTDGDGSGAVLVGYGTGRSTPPRRTRRSQHRDVAADADAAVRVISPVVRLLARNRGVDLRRLRGSGPAGVIVRRDVEAAVADPASAAPSPAALPSPAPQPSQPARRETLHGVRRAVADKLTRSRREIPDATTWVDVDATALIEAKDALRSGSPPVSLLALLARIVVAGLTHFPDLNSSVETDGDDLVVVRHTQINLGVAAQTDRGLMVPVVQDAGALSTRELAAELARLTDAARDGRLTPGELTGGTFTLNNYGVFGVDGSTPIINHPESALLGVGRIVDKPWAVGGQLAVRKVGQLSLTFDHRVCDGGVAGGFLRWIADRVESPIELLADL